MENSGIEPSSSNSFKTCDINVNLSSSRKLLEYIKACDDALKMLNDYFQNSVSITRIYFSDSVSSYSLRFTCLDDKVCIYAIVFHTVVFM